MTAHATQPVADCRKAFLVDRQPHGAHGDQVREQCTFKKSGRAEWPWPWPRSKHPLELSKEFVEIALACLHQDGRRMIIALRPAPVRAIDEDWIDACVRIPLERPHKYAIFDRRRIKRRLRI